MMFIAGFLLLRVVGEFCAYPRIPVSPGALLRDLQWRRMVHGWASTRRETTMRSIEPFPGNASLVRKRTSEALTERLAGFQRQRDAENQ
jgi:hypothetical protein